MVTKSIDQEYRLLEFEDTEEVYKEFEPSAEFEEIKDVETETRPNGAGHWGYRVPCPGVKYYTFE